MKNLWLEFLIDKFVTETTDIRCCGSCQGGCSNPAICAFFCHNYSKDNLQYYYNQNKDRLIAEFNEKMGIQNE